MWVIVVLAMFGSLIGFTQLSSQADATRVADTSQPVAVAANMASYRSAVISYATANPLFIGEATTSMLATYFPTGHAVLDTPRWRNQVLNDGTIMVYANAPPAASINDALAGLSRHSVLAGQADTGTGKIRTKGTADANQAHLPAFPAGMPDHTPVWLGHRN